MGTEIREVVTSTMGYTSGGISRHIISKGTQIVGYGSGGKYYCSVEIPGVIKKGWYVSLGATQVVTPAPPPGSSSGSASPSAEPDPDPGQPIVDPTDEMTHVVGGIVVERFFREIK